MRQGNGRGGATSFPNSGVDSFSFVRVWWWVVGSEDLPYLDHVIAKSHRVDDNCFKTEIDD